MSAELLREIINKYGFSQSQVATRLGKSPAVVNQYLQGKYNGDQTAIDKAVEQLHERLKAKEKNGLTAIFVRTETAKKVLNLCAMAHAVGDIYLLVGEAGLGKTVALKEYAKRHDGVLMLEVDPTYSSKVILSELCHLLNVQAGKTNHAMFEAVVGKLADSERLLIVDEAELLNTRALEVLRRIHDRTNIGIVLAGMPRLRANLRGAKGEFKQLYSRVGLQLDMQDRLPDDDILQLIKEGIGETEFANKILDISKGNARRLNKLLRGVKMWSQKRPDKTVTEKMVADFAAMLID